MDDIYDNLENYNEVNAVDELRDENKELKLKLQEYATSMDKLQKDFDKLSAEFKNLEKNYSALLKTARAEIERKTQTITNLNVEKDMLVLNSLQGSRNNLNIRRNMVADKKKFSDKHRRNDSITNKKENNSEETVDINLKLKNQDDEKRKVQNYLPAEVTTSSVNKKKMSTINESSDNLDSYNNRKSERKENADQVLSKYSKKNHKEDVETRAHSSKSRRKSVISNPDPKFSSDEESEDKRDVEKINKMDFLLRDNMESESFDSNYKQNIKASDTFEKSSEYKINRHDKGYDGDKYRNRDKNESYRRHKRYHSPEILNRRSKREYLNDYHHRSEHGRGRVLENFAGDDYFHQHRSRDSRTYYEREHSNDFDRHRHQEKYTTKHKIQNDYDGPSNKRLRKESYIFTEEDRRKHIEKDFAEKWAAFDKTKQHQLSSCQSPDHAQIDNSVSVKPIREIMNTAESQLEDPRLTHKKYGNTTNNSRNIELKMIDVTKWKTEHLRVPDSCSVQRPPRLSDELVKEIFMDIENTTPTSVEEGEIVESELNESIFKNMTTKNFHKTIESEFNDQINIEKETLDKLETHSENTSKTKDSLRLQNIKEKILETENPKEHPSHVVSTSINVDNCWEETKKNNSSDSNKLTSSMDQDKHEKLDFDFDKRLNHSFTRSQKTLSSKEIVEGDLELSDETCDNLVFQDQITKEKSSICSENSSKHRKKSHKHKESSSKGRVRHKTSEIKQESNKKSKSKKKEPKPEHIKTKFTDLFGDSNSLITPEDLNIVPAEIQPQSPKNYVPMFEDAVDLNVEDIMKVKTQSAKTENDATLIETKSDVVLDDVIESKSKSKKIDKANKESKNEVFKSNDDSKSFPNESSEYTNIYENLNSEVVTVKDPNVVKTVIISTGLQPQRIPTNEVTSHVNNQTVSHELGSEQDVGNHNLVAVATSTPFKTLENVKINNEASVLEPNCTSTDYVSEVVDNVAHSSNTKITECQSDTDAPDVRIFVRRRRKVLKKPTLNEG